MGGLDEGHISKSISFPPWETYQEIYLLPNFGNVSGKVGASSPAAGRLRGLHATMILTLGFPSFRFSGQTAALNGG